MISSTSCPHQVLDAMLDLSFLPSSAAHSHAAAAQALRLWGASQQQGMLREGATLLKQLDSARIEVKLLIIY